MTNKAPEIISLKALCAELKIDPKEARERLRDAIRDPKKHPELAKVHKPRSPWQWLKGSAAADDARNVIVGSIEK
ncbi:hypothetical protein B5M44_19110 [Shinella sumterensis]|uniref:hypothetical protein n=1 Tax=Shinella sumterensis TaxID=1967501 RepID=UPI00106E29D1|nr:hypothetical protein [Shinella sumterensis]MCD1266698.1 hypothetical protein [Shinella sumterensis]TFE96700.1 hypothetical protein B5M44_19110 [Shinella sumterensis]